ncbi:hypothetical protein TPHA_0E02560 [Tetrapisispora phaffii CBS 4417]|uniref:Uncharacterized protein n=1 Tax=Tetrapisispora phaffii (strain ATCC 24235 / CBS 4417 / NBRC 1672 / NRRL Y-8282 / UCD 70-5) TaxID=1071381 RepID=G8BTX0_TETPH|nr:hypothetical protein TPHA_0E02560 [Tetrapisispora phaffii CBS 4417]CCE63348.1 hypothetical protein TPHA_0E02560 [Tetrapisispora phaffii CBS 4417]
MWNLSRSNGIAGVNLVRPIIRSMIYSHRRTLNTLYDSYDSKMLGTVYTPPNLGTVIADWSKLKYDLKEEIKEYLIWKMEGDWHNMSKEEMQVIYFLSYGKYGPRSNESTEYNNPLYLILKSTFSVILFGSVVLSAINIKQDRLVQKKLEELKVKSPGIQH